MKRQAIVMNDKDNVATAVTDLQKGLEAVVEIKSQITQIAIQEDIPLGHKFAISNIATGEDIIKYASVIGQASENITIGMHVHTQNVMSLRGRGDKVIDGRDINE
ncbi:MAG: D-galactarate dehydratase [Peptococcaceae bacterium BICA1-8]|nr:MAG: D-galactarate dehydratase [Peptococcaceae bacterium BICA1-8]